MFTHIKKAFVLFWKKPREIQVISKGRFFQLCFPDNALWYLQGGKVKKGIPSRKAFFVDVISNTTISLVADGCGILPGTKFGIRGTYGEGPIILTVKELPRKVYKILQASRRPQC